jgi:response regulator of citrate/malate metabolism
MKTLRILIVEDEPLVAIPLEMVVTEIVTATVVVKESVAAAKKILHDLLDFAFLDVNVTDGKALVQRAEAGHIPLAFGGSEPGC